MTEQPSGAGLRILVLTKNPVNDGVGGELLMHRHIRAAPREWEFRFQHLHDGTIRTSPLFYRLRRGSRRRERICNAWDACRGASVKLGPILQLCATYRPHLLYTIADGPVAYRVAQAAQRTGTPWIVQLNDWFPAGLDVPHRLEPMIVSAYQRLLRAGTRLLCFSEEIREAAGCPPTARVLYPIPEPFALTEAPPPAGHALFAGRFDHFLGPEMKSLLRMLRQQGSPSRLRIIGPDADWDQETRDLVKDTEIYQGMKKGPGLHHELASAGCLLVLAPFESRRRHLARYSFPSKIPEYCRHKRPIVVWGPEESSSVQWARRSGAALAVNSSDPAQVLAAMDQLAADPGLVASLVAAAGCQAETIFRAETLQAIFEQSVREAAGLTA
jgi:hypothetical protein